MTSNNAVTYLGTTLSGNVTDHIDTRIQPARRAYYGLQGAGVCCDGVASKTLSHIYKVAIQPILTYGCSAINITHRSVNPNVPGGGQKSTTPSNYQHRIFPFNYTIVRFR